MLPSLNQFIKKLPKKVVKVLLVVCIIFFALMILSLVASKINVVSRTQDSQKRFEEIESQNEEIREAFFGVSESMSEESSNSKYVGNILVQFIDVGQADCTLVTDGDSTMLIDAGNNEDGELVVNYLQNLGISEIDYLVGTHPHEDHIGGLDDVIDAFQVGVLVMPDVTTDTQTFQDVLNAASENGVNIHHPFVGETWDIGVAECTVLSCEAVNDMSDLNEWSIVLRLDTPNTDYMFMSDAQACNEDAIMKLDGMNLSADYYRAGHHGSSDANSKAFLQMVNPDYVVISVGEDNEYGHPHRETKQLFYDIADCTIMTKDVGTISVYSYSGKFMTAFTNTDGVEKGDAA